MAIETVKDYIIVNQLLEDFKGKYNNGIRSELNDFLIGVWLFENVQLKPAISIFPHTTGIVSRMFNTNHIRRIEIEATIFMDYDVDLDQDWQRIYKTREDIENFLFSNDFTYSDSIRLGEEHKTYIGDSSDPIAMAVMNFSIQYKDENN